MLIWGKIFNQTTKIFEFRVLPTLPRPSTAASESRRWRLSNCPPGASTRSTSAAVSRQHSGNSYNQSWKPTIISVRIDILKCIKIFIFFKTQICTENASRFSRQCMQCIYWFAYCTSFLYRFAFWKKWTCGHTWENLDGQKLFGVSVSGDKL